MNSEFLLAHFDRISAAPDAIPKLRGFILDLAARGKLVEQNPTDEPAAELMNKIAATKSKLGKSAGVVRLDATGAENVPFKIPSNWVWVRLGDICSKTGSGSTPRGGKSVYQRDGVPFLRSQNVHDDGLRLDDVAYITSQTHQKMSGTAVEPGDLLLNITGGSIGRCCSVPAGFGQANVSQHVAIIRMAIGDLQGYLHPLILSPYFQSFVFSEQTGAGRGGLPKNRMDRIPVALPPLSEQLRIVSRVNDLMTLCDRLEAARAERETRRDRLTAASHHYLNNGVRAEDVPNHAHFYINHLSNITNRPEQIPALRRTILSLAIRGQLVPQDIIGESASELLKRIQAEKAQLITKRTPITQRLLPVEDNEIPYDVPVNWKWVRLSVILASSFYGPRFGAHEYSDTGTPTIRTTDMTADGRIVLRNPPKVLVPADRLQDFRCEKDDLLITRTGSIGTMAVFDGDYPAIPSAYLIRLRFTAGTCVDYIHVAMRSPYGQAALGLNTTKVAQPNINAKNLAAIPVALPPFAEQHRIVAKVDELMAVCDQLEGQLTTTQTEASRLLESVLHNTLTDTSLRNPHLGMRKEIC